MGNYLSFLFSPMGRISRKEIWLKYLLPYIGISIAAGVLDAALFPAAAAAGTGVIGVIVSLFYLWPSIAVPVKRFHDRGMTGWWVLIFAIPVIIGVVLFFVPFMMSLESGGAPDLGALAWIGLLIAVVAGIAQFVILYCLPGQKQENQYGPDPLNPAGAAADVFN